MNLKYDLTKSKRPIPEPDVKDIAKAHEQISRIGEDMLVLEGIRNILNTSDVYLQTLALSRERIYQIIERSLMIPLTAETLIEHSEIRGQLLERIRLTKELESLKIAVENKKSIKERLKDVISNWEKRLKGTG